MKKGLLGFTAIEMALLRISISFLCAIPLVYKAMKAISREKFPTLFIIGIISMLLPAILFAVSLTQGESAVNGIINSLSPLWTALIGFYVFGVAFSGKKMLGVAIGFIGAAVLVIGKPGFSFKADIIYTTLPVIATLCYGIGTNLTKQRMQSENPLYTTALSMSMVGVPSVIALFFTGAPAKIATGAVWMPLAAIAAAGITIQTMLSRLGGVQSGFEAATSSLSLSIGGIAAAASALVDTDIASESSAFAQNTLKVNIAAAVVAQAMNLAPELLALLHALPAGKA